MSQTGCNAGVTEPFALRVTGDTMLPEFANGHIIIIDPGLSACHEAYVVLEYQGEILFGQFRQQDGERWLHYMNPAFPPVQLIDSFVTKGVVVQRSTGRRKELKHYDYAG